MKIKSLITLVTLLAIAIGLQSADIKVAENPVPNNSYAKVSLSGIEKGDNVAWDIVPDPTTFDDLGDGRLFFNGLPNTKYKVTADVVNFDTKSRKRYVTYVTIGTLPQPPPVDPVNPVEPDKPAPVVPVTSYHVVFVYESADNLTPEQRGVIYGKKVEDWLSANCTTGRGGWRRRDKDSPGELDTTMAAIWKATQPKITSTPCVAVEVNTKVEIISVEDTPEKMIAVLQKYKGGK